MILYLHGFDASSAGNHEKILQLKFIDQDVRFISYSTLYPKHDMSHIMREVQRELGNSNDPNPIMVGVGLGAYWCERIAFLCGIRSVLFNPNLHPEQNMQGKIDWPEEYADIATKCVHKFRNKNKNRSICIFSTNDESQDNQAFAKELEPYYPIIWDQEQSHKFKKISAHLSTIKDFKNS